MCQQKKQNFGIKYTKFVTKKNEPSGSPSLKNSDADDRRYDDSISGKKPMDGKNFLLLQHALNSSVQHKLRFLQLGYLSLIFILDCFADSILFCKAVIASRFIDLIYFFSLLFIKTKFSVDNATGSS